MITNLWMAFDDRARATDAGRDEDNRSNAYRALGDPSVRALFRQDNPPGPRSYELWSLYYEVDAESALRDIRNDLLGEYQGQLRTIGSWWSDGRQVGTEFTFDADGTVTGTSGTPIFNLHTRILEFIPDIVTFDVDGNETSRTRPTVLSDVNLALGQAPRIFT